MHYVRCVKAFNNSKVMQFLVDAVYHCEGEEETDNGTMCRFKAVDSEGKPTLVRVLAERFRLYALMKGDQFAFISLCGAEMWKTSGITVLEVEDGPLHGLKQRVKLRYPDNAEEWTMVHLDEIFPRCGRVPSLRDVFNKPNSNMDKSLGEVLSADSQAKQKEAAALAMAVANNNGQPLEKEVKRVDAITASDNRRLVDINVKKQEIRELEEKLATAKADLKRLQ